jgi:MraZ protein
MFLGQYRHAIDDKGRLMVPARYRPLLEQGAYVTQGFDHNLIVLRPKVFESMSHNVRQLSVTDPKMREYSRQFHANAEFVELDKTGRILLPQFLRGENSLDGEAVLVGAGSYFEVWLPSLWDQQRAHLRSTQDNAQYFAELNLTADES